MRFYTYLLPYVRKRITWWFVIRWVQNKDYEGNQCSSSKSVFQPYGMQRQICISGSWGSKSPFPPWWAITVKKLCIEGLSQSLLSFVTNHRGRIARHYFWTPLSRYVFRLPITHGHENESQRQRWIHWTRRLPGANYSAPIDRPLLGHICCCLLHDQKTLAWSCCSPV